MPKLWDSLSWFVLVELSEKELARLLQDGMVQLKCHSCGDTREGTKRVNRPSKWADVEDWLRYLDAPLLRKGCDNHQLEFHATREFRERALSARSLGSPDKVGMLRAKTFRTIGAEDLPNNVGFSPTCVAPAFDDSVFDFMTRGQVNKLTNVPIKTTSN